MSEDTPRDLSDRGSFEERLFARLDAMESRFEARFSSIDVRLDRLEARLDGVEARLDRVEARLDRVEARLDGVEARLDGIAVRLDGLDVRVQALEARAFDTKPIWERALAEILLVKQGVEDLNRKIDVLNQDVLQVRADQRRVEKRMDALESRPQ